MQRSQILHPAEQRLSWALCLSSQISSRRGMGSLVLLVAVYPANIDMFINDVDVQTNASGVAERIVDAEGVRLRNFIRLPFQFLFMVVWRHTRKQPISISGS